MTFRHEKLYFACASFIAKFIVYTAYTNVFHDRKNTAKQKSEQPLLILRYTHELYSR